MIDVAENIIRLRKSLPKEVTLVAVSKFHPVSALKEAYDAGQRIFGESRAQELEKKVQEMPNDVSWHFIGHLQTNKVRSVVPIVTMIQSVDSEKLLTLINEEAARAGKVIDVLLELHVAKEDSKYGFSVADCESLARNGRLSGLENVRICGVMGMATNTDSETEIRNEFHRLKEVFLLLKSGEMKDNPAFKEISMGMSDDYQFAIEEGSTMVRIGSHIFGNRTY